MIKKQKKRRHFCHLTQSDRDRIEILLENGHGQKEIADVLNYHKGTISREIKKHKRRNGYYEAKTANHKANVKRARSKYQGFKIENNPKLKKYIVSNLKSHRSPDEIAGRMKKKGICPRVNTSTIYKWLYTVYGEQYAKYLCTQRKRRRKQKKLPKREMIPNRVSIIERPLLAMHAEGDLFVSSKKSETSRSGAIVCVPLPKLIVGTMIDNRKPKTMTLAVNDILSNISVDDLTLDNGIENKDHENFNIDTYFADPHSPWQKPHVENSIGLLRRWFIPKKTDLKNISEENLINYLHILNSKYRKSLDYKSAYEVALEYGIIQKIPDKA